MIPMMFIAHTVPDELGATNIRRLISSYFSQGK
jgi:hypothetical protein